MYSFLHNWHAIIIPKSWRSQTDFTAGSMSHLFQRTKNTAAATPTANKQNPNESDTASIVLDELSRVFSGAFDSMVLEVLLLLAPSVVCVVWESPPLWAVVVGEVFFDSVVVWLNCIVEVELGKIVLSVVVVFGCGRCTGVVFLVNGFFSAKEAIKSDQENKALLVFSC